MSTALPLTTTPWWRDAVIYQVYVRSFADGDGDGIGDLAGLRQRLDHITSLGVDGIWLNPHYASPQRDHGYDIADYFTVDPSYGDLEAFDALVTEAHTRGLRVLLDMVANHCSVDHAWFVEALAAAPHSESRKRFHFADGLGAHGELPPNNWTSIFGGPAWTRVTEADGKSGQWYLHIFDTSQPDFNWRHPDVPEFFEQVLRFWFDRGVDGFRIDVAHGMFKDNALADWPSNADGTSAYNAHMWNQPDVHEIYRSWRALAESYGRELLFVGEVWVPSNDDLLHYLADDELHQAFFFDLLVQPWGAAALSGAIRRGLAQAALTGTTTTWTLANHDVPRSVSRYGRRSVPGAIADGGGDPIQAARARGEVDLERGTARARAAALLLLALPGSVYLYQGEELGLPEVYDMPDEARTDPIFTRSGGTEIGRDGCRVPLPWNQSQLPSFGFSPAGADTAPWLPQPDWFAKLSVDAQEGDETSTLALHRRALALRGAMADGDSVEWLDTGDRDDVIAFARGRAIVVLAAGNEPFDIPPAWGQLLLSSSGATTRLLAADTAAWLLR